MTADSSSFSQEPTRGKRNPLWGFLSSVKVGVTLLVLLVIASIAGTLIESIHDTATAQRQVYHSLWFIALLLATAINLIAATWKTTLLSLAMPWSRPIITEPAAFENLSERRKISGPVTPEQMDRALAETVGPVSSQGHGLFAQCGIIQRWGAVITHVGILLLLLGGGWLSLSAHLRGSSGGRLLWIGEGMSRDWYLAPSSENPDMVEETELPFAMRLHDFDADYFPNTQIPQAFTSIIELFPGDGTSSFHPVNMNVALRWRGWKFSQSSFAMLDRTLDQRQGRYFQSMDGQAFVDLYQGGRLAIQLVNPTTGQRLPVFDAGVGLRVPVSQSDLMFETPDGRNFHLLRGETVVGQGVISGAQDFTGNIPGHNHPPPAAEQIEADTWAVRIDALYPTYRRGPEGNSTAGPEMTNPAISWTLLGDGEPVGTDLDFFNPQFHSMQFANLPIVATFEGYEPADLATWEPGEEITLHFHFNVASTGEMIEATEMRIGEVLELAVQMPPSSSQPATSELEEEELLALGPFTAALVGQMPGAYSGLAVMKESMSLKIFFYVSFLLFLTGPFVSFGFVHCRVWAWVAPDGSHALVGGNARGRRARLSHILDRVESRMKADPQ